MYTLWSLLRTYSNISHFVIIIIASTITVIILYYTYFTNYDMKTNQGAMLIVKTPTHVI